MTEEPRLVAAREELERNLYHLRRYAARVRDIDRADPGTLTDPDDRAIEAIDQFVLRFWKTVDAATRRLFPAVMAHLGEHEDGMPLIDVLNRLEKLRWIERAIDWRLARDLRNRLTHDYPEAPETRRAILLSALDLAQKIQEDVERIRLRLE
ncbi:MAG: hypothetical protein ACREXK_05580 [Gammaproteobacteria bacterium]